MTFIAAGQREALANERDSEANLREKRLAAWERSLAEQADIFVLQQRLLNTINRTRASLAADQLRQHVPAQAAVPSLAGPRQRPQGWTRQDSEHLTALLARVRQEIQQARALRAQARALIESIAATQENIAWQQDELAAEWPHHAGRYRRLAAEARAAARRSCALLGKSSAPCTRP